MEIIKFLDIAPLELVRFTSLNLRRLLEPSRMEGTKKV